MKTSDDILVAHLEGEAVLLSLKSKRYFRLNETATVVWKGLEDGLDPEAILRRLTATFDVEPDRARDELTGILDEFRAMELVEE